MSVAWRRETQNHDGRTVFQRPFYILELGDCKDIIMEPPWTNWKE